MKLRAVAIVLALLVSGCAGTVPPSNSASSVPVRIGLSYLPNVQFSPFYLAEAEGYFNTAGVSPELRHHGAAEGLFTAIVAGQEDFVVAGGDELLQARAEGMDQLVAVAPYYQSYPVEVIVPADSPIQKLSDLRGRTIGLPGKYGESWFGLQVALRSAGLTESELDIQEIGYTQQAALSTNKVDAIVGFANNDAVQFKTSGFAVRELPIASDDVPLVPASLITTESFLAEHPAQVAAVIDGMQHGIRTAVADQPRTLEVTRDYVPGLDDAENLAAAEATLAATAELWSPNGTIATELDPQQWQQMAEFMASTGLTPVLVDPTSAVGNLGSG